MSTVTLHCARHGDLFHFADDAVIGGSLARYGEWAEQELWLMHQLLSSGDTVVDVGANVGCHTLGFSRFVGEGGRVIAVEAQPAMFRLLSANVTLNAVTQAHCVFALADTARGATALPLNLSAPEHNYGAVSFADGQHRHRTGAALPVAVMALDDLALDDVPKLPQVDHVPRPLVDGAPDGHLQRIVVAVPVGVVALAEQPGVLGIGERGIVDAMGRVEAQTARHGNDWHAQ